MSKGLYFLSFTAGLAIGAVTAIMLCKDHYAQKAKEEIEVNRFVNERRKKAKEMANAAINKPAVDEYASKIENLGYKKEDSVDNEVERPYIITPEEYEEFKDYEAISLTYFADGVLADDNNDIIDDVEECVGAGFETHFGEYEDDVVYVRNDKRSCDYEIQRDLRTFEEAMAASPPLQWGD